MGILEIKNLTKKFDGVKAVNDLSLEIEKGKIVSLIGPNGSGKTTLINLLTGMMPYDSGTVAFDGKKLMRVAPHLVPSYGVTRTFQNIRLFEQMTVLDNFLVTQTARPVFKALFEKNKNAHLKKAEEFLKQVNLWEKRNQLAVNLSYGQRKLLEIVRALAMNAEVYLFDEPFAGLFPEMIKLVKGIIISLRENGKSVILVEHNMDLIREVSDEIIVLDSGELLAQGKPNEVLKKKEVIEAYLGE